MFNQVLYALWAPLRLWHAVYPTREEFIVTTILSQRLTSNEESLTFRDWRGISKTTLLLLSEGLLTHEEAIAVLVLVRAKGNGYTWSNPLNRLDLRSLNEGNKGLLELFEEVRKGEAWLRLNPKDGRFRRIARRIRVRIRDKSGRLWLREIGRKYYKAEAKYVAKLYAVSGCIQSNELQRIQLTAQREVAEELKREYPLEAFEMSLPKQGVRPDEHESDAYRGGTSVNYDYDVVLTVDPWPEEWMYEPPVIQDTVIEVYLEVLDIGQDQHMLDLDGETWKKLNRA